MAFVVDASSPDEHGSGRRGAPGVGVAGRRPGPDVVRAVALIGVVVMNYHGYLIIRGADAGSGALGDLFDPFRGPLATRFAATFVLVAGVGVSLMTNGRPRSSWTELRWRFVRRGLVLYLAGELLDRIWPGTIIVYYGAMFALAAVLFTLRSRWVLAIGAAAALASAGVNAWIFDRRLDGRSVDWLTSPGSSSVRGLVFDVAINGTHPLLPWLAFFCAGIVVGRSLDAPALLPFCVGAGLTLYSIATIVSSFATTPMQEQVLSTQPRSGSLVYTASALGTALVAFGALSWIAERFPRATDPLRRAGQLSLTIYVAHILVFNLLVDWLELVQPGGLADSLAFAGVFWVVAIVAADRWTRTHGRGPLERVYRRLGG